MRKKVEHKINFDLIELSLFSNTNPIKIKKKQKSIGADTYMTKFMVQKEIFSWTLDFIGFPINELWNEREENAAAEMWTFHSNKTRFEFKTHHFRFTLVLNESTTLAALPVQLIRMSPKHRAACAKPKRANTFAPAPSPNPITYFTCKKSKTVTKSSPSVFNDGKTKLQSK